MKQFLFIFVLSISAVSFSAIVDVWGAETHRQENDASSKCCVETIEADNFYDAKIQGEKFISYHESITLNPEQEKVKKDALESIAAPCCKDFSMYTCCCSCNLAKSVWGLSNHLIADENYNSDQVRATATKWIRFINEKGYEGDTCKNGQCHYPFNKSGCGGMGAQLVV